MPNPGAAGAVGTWRAEGAWGRAPPPPAPAAAAVVAGLGEAGAPAAPLAAAVAGGGCWTIDAGRDKGEAPCLEGVVSAADVEGVVGPPAFWLEADAGLLPAAEVGRDDVLLKVLGAAAAAAAAADGGLLAGDPAMGLTWLGHHLPTLFCYPEAYDCCTPLYQLDTADQIPLSLTVAQGWKASQPHHPGVNNATALFDSRQAVWLRRAALVHECNGVDIRITLWLHWGSLLRAGAGWPAVCCVPPAVLLVQISPGATLGWHAPYAEQPECYAR